MNSPVTGPVSGERWVRGLRAAAVVLAAACVTLGVLAWLEHRDRADGGAVAAAPSVAEQEAYAEAMRAAEATVVGLVNVDYRAIDDTYDAVASTATGTFLEDYETTFEAFEQLVTTYEAVQEGEVVASAVSTIDDDSAAVIVYAEATINNAETGDEQLARAYRVRLGMVRDQDGRWLTDQLEFVG